METNFDEKQALEDLRGVLNRIYQFANFYYAEMKAAQASNAQKISEIENLKKSYEDKLAAKDEKISALEREVFAQSKSFETKLTEYGNYNLQLTQQLQEFQKNLNARRLNLEKREVELQTAEENLQKASVALDTERTKFDAHKKSVEDKISNYDALQQAAENFDAEKNELQAKISELEQAQAANNDAEIINKLETENQALKAQVENLKGQLQSSVPAEIFDSKVQELQARIKQLEEFQPAVNSDSETIQKLEQERDYWKNRAENLQGQLEGNASN